MPKKILIPNVLPMEARDVIPSGIEVEYDDTEKVFTSPADQRTEDYVTGRFG